MHIGLALVLHDCSKLKAWTMWERYHYCVKEGAGGGGGAEN